MLGSTIIANRCWDIQNKFSYAEYPFGLDNWNSLIKLNDTNQLHSTIIFCSLPFTCFSDRELFGSFDVFKKSHVLVGENVSYYENMVVENNWQILGGIKIILPMFYLASNQSIIQDFITVKNTLNCWQIYCPLSNKIYKLT